MVKHRVAPGLPQESTSNAKSRARKQALAQEFGSKGREKQSCKWLHVALAANHKWRKHHDYETRDWGRFQMPDL